MPRYLLDTNIVICLAKGRPGSVRERLARHASDDIAISVITLGELRFGAEKSQSREQALAVIDTLSQRMQVLEMPDSAAAHYGYIRAELQRKGQTIGNNDLWLAAHARAEGLILVTNNEREFARVPALVVENWVDA